MARAGFIMQGAKGKLGDSVFGKGEKGTIQRVYSAPKNPKTAKQIAQRMVFATVNQAASIMYPLINHSFENVQEGKLSKREFVRLNTARLRALAAQDFANQPAAPDAQVFSTTKGVSTLIPNSYIVSKGSLKYNGALSVEVEGGVNDAFFKLGGFEMNASLVNDGTAVSIFVTPQDFLKSFFGMNPDEQLTVVGIEVNNDNMLYNLNDNIGAHILEGGYFAKRLVAKTFNTNTPIKIGTIDNVDNETLLDLGLIPLENFFDMEKTDQGIYNTLFEALSNGSIKVQNLDLPAANTQKEVVIQRVDEDDFRQSQYPIKATHNNGTWNTAAIGIIYSALDGAKWRRSSCVMKCQSCEDLEFGLMWSYVQEAYFKTNEIASDDIFLNTGGRDNEIA